MDARGTCFHRGSKGLKRVPHILIDHAWIPGPILDDCLGEGGDSRGISIEDLLIKFRRGLRWVMSVSPRRFERASFPQMDAIAGTVDFDLALRPATNRANITCLRGTVALGGSLGTERALRHICRKL